MPGTEPHQAPHTAILRAKPRPMAEGKA